MAEINHFGTLLLTTNEKNLLRSTLNTQINEFEARKTELTAAIIRRNSSKDEEVQNTVELLKDNVRQIDSWVNTLIGLKDMLCAEYVAVTTADLR